MKSFSKLVIFIISLFFIGQFSSKIEQVVSNQTNCVCAYDGFGYYMYLPALFDKGTLAVERDWAQGLQNEYCNGIYAYQLIPRKNGNYVNIYHMGMAFLELPSYIISDQFARWMGYRTDGFSKPYQVGFLVNALLFILLGLVFLRKLLLLFFKDKLVALLIALVYLTSNFFITSLYQYDLPHVYLFALNAIFLFYFFKYTKEKKKKQLLVSAIILGLTFAIRPTQVLWGVIPLIYLYMNRSNNKDFWKSILIFPLFAILWNIPHLFYWKIVGGELILPNLHTEEIILIDPNLIDFLFSYRKGWLIYSPFFILFFIGLVKVFKKDRLLFWGTLIFTFSYIYITSSWETWWYAASYSARPMIEVYPLLLITIGFLFQSISSLYIKTLTIGFVTGTIILNLFQSFQFTKGILHFDRMSKEHYWYIFGRIQIDNYDNSRLLMNRGDINWIDKVNSSFKIETEEIFNLKKSIKTGPIQNLRITNIFLFDKIKTDETLIEVSMSIKTSDSTQHCFLQMETCSDFSCYDWKSEEVSFGKLQNKSNEIKMKFNLPDVRHEGDWLQIYLYNPENASLEIESFKMTATSVIRK